MSLPTDLENASSSEHLISNSFSGNSADLERIRQWIDHQDRDVFDEHDELKHDIEICFQLLRLGDAIPIQSFGPSADLTHSASDIGSDCVGLDNINAITLQSVLSREESTSHPTDFSPGRSSTRFLNPELIGTGGFGIVFSVLDQQLGITVALKILRPSKSGASDARSRFICEAQTTALLSHSGIVRIYDTGHIGSLPYISSARIVGGSLAKRLGQPPFPFSPRQAAWFTAQVAEAVHFAHSKATLHRDLKPANILLEPAEEAASELLGFRPLLSDFGLAKRIDQASNQPNSTQSGGMLGTIRYMSPEQAIGATQDIGTTSDIFSLGIILYELVLGRLPFEDSNESQVRNLIAHSNPIRPRTLDASIPRDLEAIVLKCLARAPSDRYQGAHELWLDLQRFLSGEPVEAEKITWLRRARHILRRHPVAVAALGLTLIANVAAITGLVVALHIEQAAREIEQTSKDRERIAKDIERSAKEKESIARAHAQAAVAEIVTIYTGVADKIFAGSRISGEQMLTPLQKAVAILDEYTDENPDDEKMLHRLSVLKHYLAIAYQHVGNYDGFIDQRIDVLNILTQLIAKHPNNTTYQFQRFFSRQLLGVWLVNMPGHRPDLLSTNADELLELALSDIEQLVTLQPDNIDYIDALAAAKINVSNQVSMSDPPRSELLLEQGIALSEKLWNDHPDRPQLVKHAIQGYTTKAKQELKQSLISDAYESGRKAIDLFDRAWRSKSDELWVIDGAGPVFDMRADVFIAKQEWSEALRVLDERDRFTAALQSAFSHQVAYLETRFRDGLKRICILRKMGDDQRISETENRLLDLIEQHRGNNDVLPLLRRHLAPYEASESIRMSLAN